MLDSPCRPCDVHVEETSPAVRASFAFFSSLSLSAEIADRGWCS